MYLYSGAMSFSRTVLYHHVLSNRGAELGGYLAGAVALTNEIGLITDEEESRGGNEGGGSLLASSEETRWER